MRREGDVGIGHNMPVRFLLRNKVKSIIIVLLPTEWHLQALSVGTD